MKLVIKIVVVLILILVIAIVAAFFFIDRIAKTGVEQGATYALGVPTSLKSADVGVFSGTFAMSGLNVSNPEGYDTPHFLLLNDAGVEVDFGTLRSETVELPILKLTGLDMNLEKSGGKANYNVILENLKKLESGEAPPEEEPSAGKQFVIKEVIIEDINVHVDLLPIGGELSRVEVPIGEIRLTDVGTGDKGLNFSELAGVILKAVFNAVIANGADLPGEVLGELSNGLAGLSSLGEMGIGAVVDVGGVVTDVAGDVVEGLGDAAEGIGEGAGDVLEGVGDAAGDAVKGLGGLLGGGDKDDEDE